MLTDIRALADHFLMALTNINRSAAAAAAANHRPRHRLLLRHRTEHRAELSFSGSDESSSPTLVPGTDALVPDPRPRPRSTVRSRSEIFSNLD